MYRYHNIVPRVLREKIIEERLKVMIRLLELTQVLSVFHFDMYAYSR
jgi:hypothetical protein